MSDLELKSRGPGAKNRRKDDFYETPAWMVDHLIDAFEDEGYANFDELKLLEPCVGKGNIVNAFNRRWPGSSWFTNDINPAFAANAHADATNAGVWHWADSHDVVITNPPFTQAAAILQLALEHTPRVIMLLRLSFLEPTDERKGLLAKRPPDSLINMERWSFARNKKQDSVTTAWLLWGFHLRPRIQIRPGRGRQHELAI